MLLSAAALSRSILVLAGLSLPALSALAQRGGADNAASIYSCVDASGRTLTSDRPIAACADREQRELSPSGGTRRIVEPTWTAEELAVREAKKREAQQAALRAQEERRRERALLMRYPSTEVHERERKDALAQIDVVLQAARNRLVELAESRRLIDGEMEFYVKDPSKAPASLRRQVEDNDQAVAVQNRFIREQEDEKRRVNARFDEERVRLIKLWAPAK